MQKTKLTTNFFFIGMSNLSGFILFLYFFTSIFSYDGVLDMNFLIMWGGMSAISFLFFINVVKRRINSYNILNFILGVLALISISYIFSRGFDDEHLVYHVFLFVFFLIYSVMHFIYRRENSLHRNF